MVTDVSCPWDDGAGNLSYRVLGDAWRRGRRVSWRRASCGRGSRRWACCRCRALHQVDEDILLRGAADDIPPVGPADDHSRSQGAVVVVVAQVIWLDRSNGLGWQ